MNYGPGSSTESTQLLFVEDGGRHHRQRTCSPVVVVVLKIIFTIILLPIMLVLCTFVHEIGHALTGIAFGNYSRIAFSPRNRRKIAISRSVWNRIIPSFSNVLGRWKLEGIFGSHLSHWTVHLEPRTLDYLHGFRRNLRFFSSISGDILVLSMGKLLHQGFPFAWLLVVHGSR
jgi:hypothetical protein